MPIDKTIWTELWARALREPIGLYMQFTNGEMARYYLNRSRPPNHRNWTIARTADPNVLLLCAPTVDHLREENAAAHAQIASDLEDQQEPLL